MKNYYSILGLNPSATSAEIRRAYRVLARRYHPDLNPGKQAEEKFKNIAEGYQILNDPKKRKEYDREFDLKTRSRADDKFEAYRKQQNQQRPQRKKASASERYFQAQKDDYEKIKNYEQRRSQSGTTVQSASESIMNHFREGAHKLSQIVNSVLYENSERKKKKKTTTSRTANAANSKSAHLANISIIEVSVTIADSITGIKKTVEIEDPDGIRRIRVSIPPGVRSGSVVRMRANNRPEEELVLIIRVARHPFMHIDSRGLVVDVPISVQEAVSGASVMVPTLQEEQILLKVPPGTQSGKELRVRGKGINEKHGRGDLIYRMFIQLPKVTPDNGVALMAENMSVHYDRPLRENMPKTLLEAAKP